MTIEAKERAKIRDLFQRFYFENGKVGGKDLAKLESSVLAIFEKVSKQSYTDAIAKERCGIKFRCDRHGVIGTAEKSEDAHCPECEKEFFNRAKRLSADIARDLHDGLSLTAQKIAQAIESMSEEKKP